MRAGGGEGNGELSREEKDGGGGCVGDILREY